MSRLRLSTRRIEMSAAVGGIDEAGRGPLAGAVLAAIVVLAPRQRIRGVKDSKLLTARQREKLVGRIHEQALGWALGRAEVEEIDSLNIFHATMLAMERAVSALPSPPGEICVDGNRAPRFSGFAGTVRTIVGGDRSFAAISAASVLAKVARDDEMRLMHERFPQYGFADHMGYATATHREALRRFGPCPLHRRSFRRVQEALQGVLL